MKLSKIRAQHKTRMVRGEAVPKQGMTSSGMRRAMKAYGGECESVEGDKPKMRLDRMRRKSGGRVKKAEDEDEDDNREKRAHGGRLTTKEREHLPSKDFAESGRRYPIEDKSHARNALARVSQHGSESEKAKVRSAVHRKYPAIGEDD